ncbi:MAG TPA: MBOAT family O-acyltransferase [Polyangiaceae bacterium]|nr:MBOAT family O-acyltransferase [Polyangiaceae bacterium]
MLFATFDFLLFLVPVFAGYWALAGRPLARGTLLLAASYFFYAAGPKPVSGPLPPPWTFLGLLVASTLVDYVCSLRIEAARAAFRSTRFWLVVSVVANLGTLCLFKYAGFASEVARELSGLLGVRAAIPAVHLALPIGISFYTFQSLSYTLDVYRGRVRAERDPVRFALYVAFFPQLVAGPIVRADELLPQLARPPRLTRADVDVALYRIAKGVVKKTVFGDFVAASFTDRVFATPLAWSSLENLLALCAFTLQIYADFSGYSDIAIGTARLFGVILPENFERPYQAHDIADFWRRWHMTLSRWLRDYVYYPLGGSRLGTARTAVNLAITMLLVGLWHGAGWTFVAYALLHAFAMVFNRLMRTREGASRWRFGRLAAAAVSGFSAAALLDVLVLKLGMAVTFGTGGAAVALLIAALPSPERATPWRIPHVALTLAFSVLSRLFFRADDLGTARDMASMLAHPDGLGVRSGLLGNQPLEALLGGIPSLAWLQPAAKWCVLWIMLLGFALHYVPERFLERVAGGLLDRVPGPIVGAGLAAVLGVTLLLLSGPRANIYFAF